MKQHNLMWTLRGPSIPEQRSREAPSSSPWTEWETGWGSFESDPTYSSNPYSPLFYSSPWRKFHATLFLGATVLGRQGLSVDRRCLHQCFKAPDPLGSWRSRSLHSLLFFIKGSHIFTLFTVLLIPDLRILCIMFSSNPLPDHARHILPCSSSRTSSSLCFSSLHCHLARTQTNALISN